MKYVLIVVVVGLVVVVFAVAVFAIVVVVVFLSMVVAVIFRVIYKLYGVALRFFRSRYRATLLPLLCYNRGQWHRLLPYLFLLYRVIRSKQLPPFICLSF